MKSPLLAVGLWLTVTLTYAQRPSQMAVPSPVMDQFELLYPEASAIKWSTQDGLYAATFKNQKHKTILILDEDGSVKRIEADIRVSALPRKASAFLTEEVNAKRIRQATIIAPEDGAVTYEASVSATEEYVFDSDGELIGRKEN